MNVALYSMNSALYSRTSCEASGRRTARLSTAWRSASKPRFRSRMRFFSRSLRALQVAHSDAFTEVDIDTGFAQRFRDEDDAQSTRGVEVASGTANALCLGGVLHVPAKCSSLLLSRANILRSSTCAPKTCVNFIT